MNSFRHSGLPRLGRPRFARMARLRREGRTACGGPALARRITFSEPRAARPSREAAVGGVSRRPQRIT